MTFLFWPPRGLTNKLTVAQHAVAPIWDGEALRKNMSSQAATNELGLDKYEYVLGHVQEPGD
jgi:hypothetical protein